MRFLTPIVVVATVSGTLLAGCGGADEPKPALGSAERPMVATTQAPAVSPSTKTAPSARKDARTNEAAANQEPPAVRPGTGAPAPDGAKAKAPGYQALLKQKGTQKGSRFTPCNLVSERRAAAILGGPVQQPLEAPQGPTCIYRSTSGKSFVTIAVQTTSFAKLRKQLVKPSRVDVRGRAAYCGRLGQPMLYVPLTGSRVLTVTAPCPIAKAFAVSAVQTLAS
jgi:hypothetical protein